MKTYILRNIDENLHNAFKSTVSMEGKTMQQVFHDLMREYIKRRDIMIGAKFLNGSIAEDIRYNADNILAEAERRKIDVTREEDKTRYMFEDESDMIVFNNDSKNYY
jgi:hypothetical protein